MSSADYSTIFIVCISFFTINCSNHQANPTAQQLYDEGFIDYANGNYSQAIETFKQVISQHPGTQYEAFAFLKMADAQFAVSQREYKNAKQNYQQFLRLNKNSHLVPYVLERLIALNFMMNAHWFFGDYYDHYRDPLPFKNVITEYQRFYLLYPESLYLKDAKIYLHLSNDALAKHEEMIGDWYVTQSLYSSAIARYQYLLKNYPNFTESKQVVEKLIQTYRFNQQLELANELQYTYDQKFKSKLTDKTNNTNE